MAEGGTPSASTAGGGGTPGVSTAELLARGKAKERELMKSLREFFEQKCARGDGGRPQDQPTPRCAAGGACSAAPS